MRLLALLVVGCLGALAAGAGCSYDDFYEFDPVLNPVRCQEVCESFDDCVTDDYDVSSCRRRCEDAAAGDEVWEDRVGACNDCLDDGSCYVEESSCAGLCAGIVP